MLDHAQELDPVDGDDAIAGGEHDAGIAEPRAPIAAHDPRPVAGADVATGLALDCIANRRRRRPPPGTRPAAQGDSSSASQPTSTQPKTAPVVDQRFEETIIPERPPAVDQSHERTIIPTREAERDGNSSDAPTIDHSHDENDDRSATDEE